MAKSRAQQAAIAISMKKAGKKPALKKAQFGNTGPGGTTVKSNIGPKIAGVIGAGITAAALAINRAKKKKAEKLAAKAKNPEDTVSKKYGGSAKRK